MVGAAIDTVRVNLAERSYDITIGTGVLGRLGELITLESRLQPGWTKQAQGSAPTWHAVLITDEHVEAPHAMTVATSLTEAGAAVDVLVVPSGEPSKSIDVAADLWQRMLAVETDRRSIVIAVGGGVIGDLAGFVAATFTRGLNFYQVPTTLLAQVDSSVGGKVGINLPGAKNMVGAFWQPRGVLADTAVLATLPDREYRAGLAEVVKYGVILDAEFFAYLEAHIAQLNNRDDAVLRHVVQRSCRLKADVVEADEREETGHRAVLNYGHTFCHALEAVTGYEQFLHGEAVSIGMLCASRLAERLGRITAEDTARQHDLLMALNLPVVMPDVDATDMLAAMRHDKKVAAGKLRFVLPSRIGHVELVGDVNEEDVRAAMDNS